MLPVLSYLACFAAIVPAVALALFFWTVGRVATAPGWPGIGRLLLQLIELVGSPWKILAIALAVLGLIAAGCVRSSRGWACLVLGLLGLVCLVQILLLARPRELGEFATLVPSALATLLALGWAWRLLRTGMVAP